MKEDNDDPRALDAERLARAMHPSWFEPVPEHTPDGMTAKEWALLRYDVSRRQDQARREAAEVLDRLAILDTAATPSDAGALREALRATGDTPCGRHADLGFVHGVLGCADCAAPSPPTDRLREIGRAALAWWEEAERNGPMEAQRYGDLVAAIAELHRPTDDGRECRYDGRLWPCGHDLVRAALTGRPTDD